MEVGTYLAGSPPGEGAACGMDMEVEEYDTSCTEGPSEGLQSATYDEYHSNYSHGTAHASSVHPTLCYGSEMPMHQSWGTEMDAEFPTTESDGSVETDGALGASLISVLDEQLLEHMPTHPELHPTAPEWSAYTDWMQCIGCRPRELRMAEQGVITTRMCVFLHFLRAGVPIERIQEGNVDTAAGWLRRGRSANHAHFIQVPLMNKDQSRFSTEITAFWWLSPQSGPVPVTSLRMGLYTRVGLCHIIETIPRALAAAPKRAPQHVPGVDVDKAMRSLGGFLRKRIRKHKKKIPRGFPDVAGEWAERQGGAQWTWAHLQQRFDWDCGIACVEMVMFAGGYSAAGDLRQLLPTRSVWTIHLAHLLFDLGIKATYCSQTTRANYGHFQNPFYAQSPDLQEELTEVNTLFQKAEERGIPMHQKVLSLPEIAKFIMAGPAAIVVVDSRHLRCNECGHGKAVGDSFYGHFIVLTGFDSSSCTFSYLDPATRHEHCTISAADLDVARKSEGTEYDTIILWGE